MLLPTTELLSVVLGKEVTEVKHYCEEVYKMELSSMAFVSAGFRPKREITVVINNKEVSINIYELMHLMKEWAWNIGYQLHTEMITSHITKKLAYKVSIEPTEYHKFSKVGDTEPEAVTEACLWVLNNP